ncbi:MAG TPA: carboxypeptidase-like regulatory domain-containing protein [Terriglobales bacterium]|nr:carboxypeptidase-like regulatory domain-containing protein [Terriglobales bacterium]
MLRTRTLAAVFGLAMLLSGLAAAQGGATGAISGKVQDQTGSVLPGATVKIVNEATNQPVRQLTTDASGAFTATLLPVGTYSVEISAAGFATTRFPSVVVRITETTSMTATVKPSTVKEVVEVQSDVAAVETTAATTGESLGNTTITSLPLATRNFQQLLTLSAGASSDLNNASQLGRGVVVIHVNGGREDNNNYLIEGISASDYAFGELTYTPLPSPEAVQEFKVSTSLYDASQGRNGGGNINATLKSGTGRFHGDLWEYLRNTSLDAQDYFLGKVVIKQNIFGGDLGGPAGKSAQFGYFYVNYQGTRQRSGASPGTFINNVTGIPYVPLADRQNVNALAADCGLTSQGLSVDPVAFNLLNVKSNQFGPTAGGYLFPLPTNVPSSTACGTPVPFHVTNPGKFTDDQLTTTWDKDLRAGKDHLGLRFFWSDSDTSQPFGADNFGIQTGGQPATNNLNFPLDIPLHSRFGSITETHLFSNVLVNEFRFGVNVIGDKLHNEAPITGAAVGINLPTANQDPNMYRLHFGTFEFGPYPTEQQSALSDNFVWLDTVSWTHAAHQLRFGGEIDRVTLRRNLPISDNGYVFFIPVGPPTANTDFQSFLAGSPLLGEGGGGLGNHDYRVPSYAWFVQDDYRVRKNLSLNFGFRNEFVGAPYDTLCHTGNTNQFLAPSTGQPFVYPKCIKQFGLTGITGTLNQAGLNNEYATVWEPRIGFAYDVGGKATTSIRGGYGIYSVREDLGAVDNLAISPPAYPFKVGFLPGPGSLANLFSTAFPIPPLGAPPTQPFVPVPSFFTGFPGGDTTGAPNFSGTVQSLIELAVPFHWVVGTTQQWNLTVQRDLFRNWVMELGYVGTKGSRLRSTTDDGQATLATPTHPVVIPYNCATGGPGSCTIIDSTASNAPARARYLGINAVDFEDFAPNSDSHYSSLQASLARRFSKGLYFQGAYTYAKSIDDVSTASVAFVTRVNDQLNARASRGLSDFDRRHRFVASAVYQLPFFSGSHGFTKAVLSGWETSPVVILQSGSPFTVFDPAGGSAYNLASPASTATFSPGFSCSNAPSRGSITSRLSNWVNPLAYSPDPSAPVGTPGTIEATVYGNAPRNCIIGPHQRNMDLTMSKTFQVTERQNLLFRADFFNLFNHPSFANPPFQGAVAGSTPGSGLAPITSVVGTPRLIQFALKYSF